MASMEYIVHTNTYIVNVYVYIKINTNATCISLMFFKCFEHTEFGAWNASGVHHVWRDRATQCYHNKILEFPQRHFVVSASLLLSLTWYQ